MADNMTRAEFTEYMTAFEQRFDQRIDRLEQKMAIEFEEVKRHIRLSLEGLDALRETTGKGFEAMQANHESQILLVHDVIRHVRRRVEAVEERRD